MKRDSITVQAIWDDEAHVWVASSTDIDGLAVEAETVEQLRIKVVDAISDLIELNGLAFDAREISVHILADHMAKVPNPSF
ncbi:DUF1902 domain-containing protein [Martelella sp. AD-3]|uniref:DUF1902 domain-containing protein n=1 Tax=Martelella sp. AD-3 TaxID=686597 RepID=UPI000464B36F|nr:DUF1902 domain-containing protein [Martelella sp. AD-3]AMM85143.1 hypothetical protein AZF01_12860 [Martelella sp. AD-3]